MNWTESRLNAWINSLEISFASKNVLKVEMQSNRLMKLLETHEVLDYQYIGSIVDEVERMVISKELGDLAKNFTRVVEIHSKGQLMELLNKHWSIRTIPLPSEFIDSEVMQLIVTKHPLDILSVPLLELEYQMAYNAVRACLHGTLNTPGTNPSWYSTLFMDLPNKFKDHSLCEEAYGVNNDLAFFMPEEHVSYDMIYKHSVTKGSVYNSLEKVPKHFKTAEICRNYVQYVSGINIHYVPSEFVTQHLCDLAFKENANAIGYIPEPFRSYEMCLAAASEVSVFREQLPSHIPKQFQTTEFWGNYHERNVGKGCGCKSCTKCLCPNCVTVS